MADIELKALPPKEAIAYFRSKGYKPTFDWRDMWQEEHSYSFTIAKAMRTDILQDIRQSMDKAIAEGTTFADFRKELRPVLQQKGWWGRKMMTDPLTGEEKEVQLGSSRRLRTIFDTNMRTSYAAGRWEQVQRTKTKRPWLRYLTVGDARVRDQHAQWHNVIKPVDDPFWDDHYPPNGWKCRCTTQQLSERDLERQGLTETKGDFDGPLKTWVDNRNGRTITIPRGIEPGFSYNAGKARMRGLTPPQLDKPVQIPYSGPLIDVAPPEPRSFPAELLLEDGLNEEDYIKAFLGEFGADIGKPVVFQDKIGEPIIISDDLFRTTSGKLKVSRRMRHRYMLLLAKALKDPDEILWVWEEYPKGRMTLTRRYLTRWKGDANNSGGFLLFDSGNAGWRGVTAFPAEKENYLANQRTGTLAYRREK